MNSPTTLGSSWAAWRIGTWCSGGMPEVTFQLFVHERIVDGGPVVYVHEPRFGATATGATEGEAIEAVRALLSTAITNPRLVTFQWEVPNADPEVLLAVTARERAATLNERMAAAVNETEESFFGELPRADSAPSGLTQYRPNQWRPGMPAEDPRLEGMPTEDPRPYFDEFQPYRGTRADNILNACRELAEALLPHASPTLQEAQARAFLRMGEPLIDASIDRLNVSRQRGAIEPNPVASRFELMDDESGS